MAKFKKTTKPTSRNPAGRPKDAAKRGAILAAAQKHFLRNGFEKTSLDVVAKEADVSKLTIYSHFKDKDALFKAVIQGRCEQHNNSECYLDMVKMTPKQALEHIGVNLVNLVLSDESISMHRIIEAESSRHPKIATLFYEAGPTRVKTALGDLLRAWVKQKKLRITDMNKAIEHFLCLIKGEAHMRMLMNLQKRPSAAASKQHVQSCVAMFLARYK